MNASQSGVGAALAAFCALHNNGSLQFFSGTQPATPETALSGNTLLCTATYSAAAFGAPAFSTPNMEAVASFTAANFDPVATDVCTFARAYEADGTTVLADYTVGTTGTDIIIGNTTIQTGVPLAVTQTIKMPAV